MDPELYNSTLWLRQNKVTEELDLNFSVTEEVAGEVHTQAP